MEETNHKKPFVLGFAAGAAVVALIGLLLFSAGLIGTQGNVLPVDSGLSSSEPPAVVSADPEPTPVRPLPSESSDSPKPASELPIDQPPVTPPTREVIGEFAVLRDSDLINTLADEHLELIYRYFDSYYRSVAGLKAENLLTYFQPRTDEEYENSILNQLSLQMLCGMRALRENDLRLDRYQYGIRLTAIDERSPDCFVVDLVEDSAVHFAFLDETITSGTSGIQHRFVLVRDLDDEWYIASHEQDEDFFQSIQSRYRALRGGEVLTDRERVNAIFYDIYDRLLAAVEQDELRRLAQQETARVDARLPANQYTWRHEYDRDTAVGYSYLWIDGLKTLRNSAWQVYDSNGTNYVSQSIYAGGIPMDCTGDAQWKWCGDAINTTQRMIGRSASWTDVDAFYIYSRSNDKGGPVTLTDGNIFSTRPGDVLQLGLLDGWYQTTLITEVISDPQGIPTDLLVNTNTTDRIDYPASAFGASDLRAIRILGFN